VILAIALGLWGGIFMVAFSWGMTEQRTRYALENEVSHIQIHTPAYSEDPKAEFYFENAAQIIAFAEADPGVREATPRVISSGMISSAKGAFGVQITGIDPEKEALVTQLSGKIREGDYFTDEGRNPVIISSRMAEKLKVGLRKKVVLMFQNLDGEIVSGAFRISGIYRSSNSRFDETYVYVRESDLYPLLGKSGITHEVAILMEDASRLDSLSASLTAAYPDLKVEDWKALSPDLSFVSEAFDQYIQLFMVIIMLALAFGIINTMLMAVLERYRELGMLMSIGMSRIRIFLMIMLETVFLALVGGPAGLLIAWATVSYFAVRGIDLSSFSEGLSQWGYESIVYTALDPKYYIQIAVWVVLTAILSSIYPAIKALRLNPVEAIRKI
jgi:ABC-type lipoprotein release transport system permease subunit